MGEERRDIKFQEGSSFMLFMWQNGHKFARHFLILMPSVRLRDLTRDESQHQMQQNPQDFNVIPEQFRAVSILLSKESDIDLTDSSTRAVLNWLRIKKTPILK